MLGQALRNFELIEEKNKQFIGPNKAIVVSSEAAEFIKLQTPKVIGVLEDRTVVERKNNAEDNYDDVDSLVQQMEAKLNVIDQET